jgi:hypothetical protein
MPDQQSDQNRSDPEILAALRSLVNSQMGLSLGFSGHEDGSELEPFGWDEARQGCLSPLNLLRSAGWMKSISVAEALQNWQLSEVGAVGGDRSLIPEGDPAGLLLDEMVHSERARRYAELRQLLEAELQNLAAFELSCDGSYRLAILVGQTAESWVSVAPMVPIATPPNDAPLQTAALAQARSPAPLSQIQDKLDQLGVIKIYGYYGGGYNQTHDYGFKQAAGETQTEAIELLLQQVGLLSISQFEAFAPNLPSADQEVCTQFESLQDFLSRSLSQSFVYRFSFWNWEQLYIIGPVVGKAEAGSTGSESTQEATIWAGVILRSQFTYNP